MVEAATNPCAGCQRLQAQLEEQRAQLEQVLAKVARLEEQIAAARKNSSTSSKPPSSDIVKPPPPPPPAGQDKRQRGPVGPRLTTPIAYLKGFCHASFSTVRKFLRDVVGMTISRGLLVKIIDKVSTALEAPYEELLEALPGEPLLNVDETGHKDNG